ncbi:hypothetical protein ACIBCH_16440 [Amycolatopsis thailandensis]|uniref:hypothetical protein n=1 Tax=Amycolatopsis thailandensis TaxID=589330 RepID=UPI0037A036EF
MGPGIERRTAAVPVAPLSALGRMGSAQWQVELDRGGALAVTGATGAWADELAVSSDPAAWLLEQGGLRSLTEGMIFAAGTVPGVGDKPEFLPARGPEIPVGPVHPALPARLEPAPGRELRMSGHERASERWVLRVLADGTLANGAGDFDPLDPGALKDTDDPAAVWRACFHDEDPDMWSETVEIVRSTIAAIPRPLVAACGWLGSVEISVKGEVVASGRHGGTLLGLLEDAGLKRDPYGAMRRLAGRLPEIGEPTPGVVITVGDRITPYTSRL